jgi:DNA-binding IscR family transcriptional regulator
MTSITAKHAVRALVELAAVPPQASLAGRELAAAAGIPRNYEETTLAALVSRPAAVSAVTTREARP